MNEKISSSRGGDRYELPSHKDRVRDVDGVEQLAAWKRFTDDFWRTPPAGTPTNKTEFVFRRGFKRDKWALYELERNDPAGYISDLQVQLMPKANTVYSRVLENRVLLLQAASRTLATPGIYSMRDQNVGEVVFSERWAAAIDGSATEPLDAYVQPLNTGVRGKTATFRIAGKRYTGAGRAGSIERLRSTVRDWAAAAGCPYLFTEVVEQGSFTGGMAPGGHNSLHLLICRDHATWRPHVAAAVLRVGTSASGGSGKIQSGGVSFWIEPDSGRITAGAMLRDGKLRRMERHPDTEVPVVDAVVPGWDRILADAVGFFDQSNYLHVAGFDFVLGDAGATLIGGGNTPDVAAIQVHKPLINDPIVAEFLRREKI